MDAQQWQDYVNTEMPIIGNSQFKIIDAKPGVVLVKGMVQAHRTPGLTVYEGSISSMSTLCAWIAIKSLLEDVYPDSEVSLQSSKVKYLQPLTKDFYARTRDIKVKDIVKLKNALTRRGKGHILVKVDVFSEPSEVRVEFEAEFVVLKS